MNRKPKHPRAWLSKPQLHHALNVETRHWLQGGHQIVQLPPGRCRGLGRYESLLDIATESGIIYEQ